MLFQTELKHGMTDFPNPQQDIYYNYSTYNKLQLGLLNDKLKLHQFCSLNKIQQTTLSNNEDLDRIHI